MKKIVVGSENVAKLAAVRSGFAAMFPNEEFEIRGIAVASGVADQPMSDKETLRGAMNRAHNAHQLDPSADFAIGLEGGIEEIDGKFSSSAWIYIISKNGLIGRGRTGAFFIPEEATKLVRSGIELGKAMNIVCNVQDSKHSSGSTGLLTHTALERTEYYVQAVILALIPHKNPELSF